MKLSDVIHLYLGCQVFLPEYNKTGRLSGMDHHEKGIWMFSVQYPDDSPEDYDVINENEEIDRIKPILRRLSSMTEEEIIKIFEIEFGSDAKYSDLSYDKVEDLWLADYNRHKRVAIRSSHCSIELFIWFIKNSFDLFGLIDSQQAIEK